jgi:hypothetical protein
MIAYVQLAAEVLRTKFCGENQQLRQARKL